MNKKIMATALMAIFLTAGSTAFAENDKHRGHGSHSQHDRGHGHDNHHKQGKKDKHASHHAHGRGAGPKHNYYKGGYVPREYRQRQYVVNDWHDRHLHAPPRGYQWVQTGGDYILISISNGLIAQIVLSN